MIQLLLTPLKKNQSFVFFVFLAHKLLIGINMFPFQHTGLIFTLKDLL